MARRASASAPPRCGGTGRTSGPERPSVRRSGNTLVPSRPALCAAASVAAMAGPPRAHERHRLLAGLRRAQAAPARVSGQLRLDRVFDPDDHQPRERLAGRRLAAGARISPRTRGGEWLPRSAPAARSRPVSRLPDRCVSKLALLALETDHRHNHQLLSRPASLDAHIAHGGFTRRPITLLDVLPASTAPVASSPLRSQKRPERGATPRVAEAAVSVDARVDQLDERSHPLRGARGRASGRCRSLPTCSGRR